MSRSRSRSGSVDMGQKNHYSSVLSRTFSATKLCRGGSQINLKALTHVDKKPASKVSNSSQNQADKVVSLQRRIKELEEELTRTKQRLSVAEVEKDQTFDQLRGELMAENENLKSLLSESRDELNIKDQRIVSLESELAKARVNELELAEKDALLDNLNKENGKELLSCNKKRIEELEAEVERQNQAKSEMVDLLTIKDKQLDDAKNELEESKIGIASLRYKFEKTIIEVESLKFELQMTKESLVQAEENGRKASLKAMSVFEEMRVRKHELKLAAEAENKSAKAVEETEKLKSIVRKTEEKYNEAKQEAELHKNTANRLRIEAEETVSAWNGKEMCFVSCIKRAEDERASAQHENIRLRESLRDAQHMLRAAREETCKLRDIVKQAVDEANSAKVAAGLARDENSRLKDCIAEKDLALCLFTQENRYLNRNEAAALENVTAFKTSTPTEYKTEEKEKSATPSSIQNKTDEDNEKKNMNAPSSHEDQKGSGEDDSKRLGEEESRDSVLDLSPEATKQESYSTYLVDLDREDNDSDTDTSSDRRMSAMLRRMGDLLKIRRNVFSLE